MDSQERYYQDKLAKKRRLAKAKITTPKKKKYKKPKLSAKQYKLQYKSVEWIELRERIIDRDNNRCKQCGKQSDIFHVHHLLYELNKKVWEVPDYYLVTLCPECHKKEHSRILYAPTKHF